jgi:ABC-type phosphate transport system substrate-binding protein
MLLVVKGKPSAAEKAFIDFVLGDGQKIIESHGYIPVNGIAQR